METIMTKKGVTTLIEKNAEQHEEFEARGRTFVHYDYRHSTGVLFSCVKSTLKECQEARDKWVKEKYGSN